MSRTFDEYGWVVPAQQGRWARRLTAVALILSIGGALAAVAGIAGTRLSLWDYETGLLIMRSGAPVSVVGGALSVIALAFAQQAKIRGLRTRGVLALAVASVVLLVLGRPLYAYYALPSATETVTDPEEVPKFRALRGREDVPAENSNVVPVEPLRVSWTVQETMAKAQAVAEKAGWNIVYFDPARGRLEAIAPRRLFGVHDEVVLRARKDEDGKGTRVDLRVVSRNDAHDLGAKAALAREFLKDLRQS